MGKLKIGTRVRDNDGDEGVIVGKSKGYRDVKYDKFGGTCTFPKSYLTSIPANDNAPVAEEARPELCNTAYSVGDRVMMRKDSQWYCDETESEGTIVEPNEGTTNRLGVIFDGDTFKWHVSAADLTPVVATATTEWTPKVGQTVRFKTDKPESGAVYFEGELTVTEIYDTTVVVRYPLLGSWDEDHLTQEVYPRDILPVAEQPAGESGEVVATATLEAGKSYPDTTGKQVGPLIAFYGGFIEKEGDGRKWSPDGSALGKHAALIPTSIAPPTTWAPTVGKFGKTRDGRKVGPLNERNEEFGGGAYGEIEGTTKAFEKDGRHAYHNADLDLVAEWVEPEPTPFTLEAGRTYKTRDGRKSSPVVHDSRYGEWRFSADGWTYREDGSQAYNKGELRSADLVALWTDEPSTPEPVVVAEATATPTPDTKFKTGDRVVYVGKHPRTTSPERVGWLGVVKSISEDCAQVDYDNGEWGNQFFQNIALAPSTFTPGATVTFTATGKVSAINENGHIQVTFPNLEPGQNSFALPAKYVALAN